MFRNVSSRRAEILKRDVVASGSKLCFPIRVFTKNKFFVYFVELGLRDLAILQLFLSLLAGLCNGFVCFLRLLNALRELSLPGRQQVNIARVELQCRFDRLKLFLCFFYLCVGFLKGILQSCGVAADFDCYAFDLLCHNV